MLKVICFGEALIDMLSNHIDENSSDAEKFTKYPGGAPANASVVVAKLGGNSYFSGMLGKDPFGRFIYRSLSEQNVNTDYVRFTSEEKTGLAFISLDIEGERSFEFYRPPAADLCFKTSDFEKTWFNNKGIFHFCSNSLTEQSISDATRTGIEMANKNGWLISFDVNLRTQLWTKADQINTSIEPFMALADIIKMSQDELTFMSGKLTEERYIESLLDKGVSLILVTDGANPVRWHSLYSQGSLLPIPVKAVDTTAAGDAFIGGFLYYLSSKIVSKEKILEWTKPNDNIEDALIFANACGAHAVSISGAFPSLPSQASLKPFLSK